MKKFLALAFISTIVGCASVDQEAQQDNYIEASFELCNTDVRVYSNSDDGRIRIICADDSKFSLKSPETLEIMREFNAGYCMSSGLGHFSESRKYYQFKCKEGALISIIK